MEMLFIMTDYDIGQYDVYDELIDCNTGYDVYNVFNTVTLDMISMMS